MSHEETKTVKLDQLGNLPLNVDEILNNLVGSHGLWQFMIVILICFSSSSAIIFPVYANSIPRYRCKLETSVEKKLTETMFDFKDGVSPNASQQYLSFDKIASLIGPWPTDNLREGTYRGKYGCFRFKINASSIYWPDVISNNNKNYSIGHPKEPCLNGYVYEPWPYQFPDTIVSEWDLVCDAAWKGPFSTSIYMLGMMIGFILGGFLSDFIGRKYTIHGASIFEFIFGVSVSFSPNYASYVTFRGLLSIACTTKVSAISVLIVEMTTAQYRPIFAAGWSIYTNFLTRSCHSFLATVVPTWRKLHLVVMSPSLIGIFALYFIYESPRWLISQTRNEEAVNILYKAYRINRMCSTTQTDTLTKGEFFAILNTNELIPDSYNVTFSKLVKTYIYHIATRIRSKCSCGNVSSFLDSISGPYRSQRMRRLSLICTSVFACQLCTFFGIMFYSQIVRGSIYIISFINACTSLPATFLSTIVYSRSKSRNKPLIVIYTMAGITLLAGGLYATIIQPVSEIPLIICCTFSLFLLGASFNMIFIYIPELFPSIIRTQGFGNASGFGRVGSIICSFINQLDVEVRHGLPVAIYGVVSLLEVGILLHAPDTNGDNLKDNIETETKNSQTEE